MHSSHGGEAKGLLQNMPQLPHPFKHRLSNTVGAFSLLLQSDEDNFSYGWHLLHRSHGHGSCRPTANSMQRDKEKASFSATEAISLLVKYIEQPRIDRAETASLLMHSPSNILIVVHEPANFQCREIRRYRQTALLLSRENASVRTTSDSHRIHL